MSDAWLTQCGDGVAERQVFEVTWTLNAALEVSITGGIWCEIAPGSGNILVSPEMEPGVWVFETSHDSGDHSARTYEFAWQIRYGFTGGFSAIPPVCSDIPGSLTGAAVLSTEFGVISSPSSAVRMYNTGNHCQMLAFVLSFSAAIFPALSGDETCSWTFSGVRIAGPDCPDP